MKKLLSTFIGLLTALTLFAQIPQSFNYQAVLRDNAGEIIANQAVDINLGILQGSVDGTAVYTEDHTIETNAFGLVNLQIGQGTSSDDFSAINWAEGPYFIRVVVDGTEMGITQLLSVPYALYAEQAGNTFSGSYNDLTDVPANLDPSNNFSGSFNDLSDIPENLDTDSTDDFRGSFNDLADIPENLDLDSTDDFSGDYNDLTNKPEIPEAVEQTFHENDSVAFINDKKVGIGTEQARGKLEVFKGGVVFAGDSGTVDIAGEGTRLMWIPEKAAFRAGKVDAEQWDMSAIGDFSVAMGDNTTADGFISTAMGSSTIASGSASTAMGSGTTASGNTSTAMGVNTQAIGTASTTMGNDTEASGESSIAIGSFSEASGNASTAIGRVAKASGLASIAMGEGPVAIGNFSISMGFVTATRGSFSTAIGNNAKANHNGAVVIAANSNVIPTDSIASAINDQMVLRADGNFFFCNDKVTVPSEPAKLINTSTGAFLSTGGTWTNASDRNLKENFTFVDVESLMEKIKTLEVTTWNYKAEGDSVTHIGPMAQDFYRLYGFGQDEKSIATVDGIGVALATIKVLVERNEMLESRLDALENMILQLLPASRAATPEALNK